MITDKEQIFHEIQIHRLLSEILDDKYLSLNVFFKGGTCARMLGLLDRFSVDLDFDLNTDADKKEVRSRLYKIFNKLDLDIRDESKKALQFFLKYSASGERNTIKLEILDKIYSTNIYEPKHVSGINRTAICQSIETMFAHKLIALTDRKKIAGRDVYDIHHFFLKGYNYNHKIIEERTGMSVLEYLQKLEDVVDKKVTRRVIDEDINTLLDYDTFKKVRKYLKEETLKFIKIEMARWLKKR